MSFLIALALTVVIYLCSYFLLFLGYITLICKQPENKRTFTIPGGNSVKIIVAIIDLLTSLVAFVVSFFPPSGLAGREANDIYAGLLVVSFLIVLAIPFIIYALHDKKGKIHNVKLLPITAETAPKGHFFIHPKVRSPHHIIVDDNNVH